MPGNTGASTVEVAEHLHHPSLRTSRRRRKARQLRHDHVAHPRAGMLPGRHLHVHRQTAVQRHHVAGPGAVRVVAANELRGGAFHDAKDAALGSAGIAPPLDPHNHPVAVHRLIEIRSGDVHVAREIVHRMVGSDESESARMNLHPAGHQVHPIGQAVAVAPNPDQIAALDEHGETAAQRRALIARPAEPLQQLPHGRGMIHRSSNLVEQLVRVEHRRGRRYAISATCRSPTLVSVGPVRIRSSSASKKVWESFAAR